MNYLDVLAVWSSVVTLGVITGLFFEALFRLR